MHRSLTDSGMGEYTSHINGPPESPRQASRPPRSKPAQNMLFVSRYNGRKSVRFLHSSVDTSGTCTCCRVSAVNGDGGI